MEKILWAATNNRRSFDSALRAPLRMKLISGGCVAGASGLLRFFASLRMTARGVDGAWCWSVVMTARGVDGAW
jgi:hypothetical protein